MYQKLQVKIEGISPMIMHNGQLADPLNPFARQLKELTLIPGKKRTEAIIEQMSAIEWEGGLYLDSDGAICVPGVNIERVIVEGAKKSRQGREFTSGLICDGNWPLKHDGPADVKKLYKNKAFVDRRGVGVTTSRVMRTRPIFNVWSLAFEVQYLPSLINEDAVLKALETAGQQIGLGDFRPRFGRFVVAA